MLFKILELYSGIGGMHCAWNESGLPGTIVAAVDINTVANEVYKFNFLTTNLINRNIQSLNPMEIKKLQVNTILMSPPCQPFTRNGKFRDDNDPRTNSFIHIIEILDQLHEIEYILMENVKGFECSTVRDIFIEKLKKLEFNYQEFLLCPTSFGIPNSRLRYYCLARRTTAPWNFKTKDIIMTSLPKDYGDPNPIESILESNLDNQFLVPEKLLKRANLFDVCYKHSKRTCCFTKAYTHYSEGTGSVFTEASLDIVEKCYKKANTFEMGSNDFIESLKELNLRFFTPNEVLVLMAFPKYYNFPENTSIKQRYRLLGNSVNVKIITELLKLLFD